MQERISKQNGLSNASVVLNTMDMDDMIAISGTRPFSASMSSINMGSVPLKSAEDDTSSLSSNISDPFDHGTPLLGGARAKWQMGADGNLQRYGSPESGEETGISSVSSLISVHESAHKSKTLKIIVRKRLPKEELPRPTKRRVSGCHTSPYPQEEALPAIVSARVSQLPETPKNPALIVSDVASPASTSPNACRTSRLKKLKSDIRPRSAIPYRLPLEEYAFQCITAARAARLNPYALHRDEHKMLHDHLSHDQVTVFLNIRNGILRLWSRNTLCSVTPEEAVGCAKETRYFELAYIAYQWLVRYGYINFGCVGVPPHLNPVVKKRKNARQRTIVVIGAGVAGLSTARQLEGVISQTPEDWISKGELPPKVIVLEARTRIGGRVYSKPLRTQVKNSLPGNLRNTAEMGAMIVTGFEHGNPLDTIIRGQLGLRYHLMTDSLKIYDCDGRAVEQERDTLVTDLYTDISDRAGHFRARAMTAETLKGNEDLIDRCRDPLLAGTMPTTLEATFSAPKLDTKTKPAAKRGRRRNAPPGNEKLAGQSQEAEGSSATKCAGRAAREMGWELREGISKRHTLSLDAASKATQRPTLGDVMDDAIRQYQGLLELTPQDLRLLNWHHANLEYANAAPISQLSLSGHDQDNGNEFEGAHSEIIGGYTQVPRGLASLPTKLDIHFEKVASSIQYDPEGSGRSGPSAKVICADGETIEADEVVLTSPLGVLKEGAIAFNPPLPDWKQSAIDRMGFGLLNKVVLLYDYAFWDDSRDMFGLLNEAECHNSLDPAHYAKKRGRFYLLWNCSKISGRPMLIALMAGEAAHYAEETTTATLVDEVTDRLRCTFGRNTVPMPREVIVTRWKKDPFTRGTYSYVGPETKPGDYDLMAKSLGNLHFAGEATCGTHPATVHGAFLSGLRAAAEVVDSMAGPITAPEQLIADVEDVQEQRPTIKKRLGRPPKLSNAPKPPKATKTHTSAAAGGSWSSVSPPSAPVVKQEHVDVAMAGIPPNLPLDNPPQNANPFSAPSLIDLDLESAVAATTYSKIGERPLKPSRPGVNPFLLYTKEKWEDCKAYLSTRNHAPPLSGKNEIRKTLGEWWRRAPQELKGPYLLQAQTAQDLASAVRSDYENKAAQWDKDAKSIRKDFVRDHPLSSSVDAAFTGPAFVEGVGITKRKSNVSAYAALNAI